MDKYLAELENEKMCLEGKIARLSLFLYRKDTLKLSCFPYDDDSLRCPISMLKDQLERMLALLSMLDIRIKIARHEYVDDCYFANDKDKERFQGR